MRFYLILFLLSFSCFADDELTNCIKHESDSLWVEHHSCDQGQVQIGHELFNESVVLVDNSKTTQQYQEKNNKVNIKYLKTIRSLRFENE